MGRSEQLRPVDTTEPEAEAEILRACFKRGHRQARDYARLLVAFRGALFSGRPSIPRASRLPSTPIRPFSSSSSNSIVTEAEYPVFENAESLPLGDNFHHHMASATEEDDITQDSDAKG